MSLTAIQIIEIQCPDLYTDPNLNKWISLAQERTNRCFFGKNYNQAVALRACHMYTLSLRIGGASGVISSKKEGDLSVSYAQNSSDTDGYDDLLLTHYGKQLKSLMKATSMGVSVLGAQPTGVTIIC